MAETIVEIGKGYVGTKPIEIRLMFEETVPSAINADREGLERVLLNLMNNAIKYTDKGTVTLMVSADSRIVSFSVIDTGRGINQDMHQKIFEPYHRGDNKSKETGTGLGLAISSELIKRMNGTIGVTSAPGIGSTFRIDIPLELASEEPSTHQDNSPAWQKPNAGLNVLIAEDTLSSQVVIRLMLEKFGHTVTIVENGAEAVTAAKSSRFDLVILDGQMPVTNGYEAARQIRQLPYNEEGTRPSVPILGLSALGFENDKQVAIASGMTAYLVKPIKSADMARCLADLMPNTKLNSATWVPKCADADLTMMPPTTGENGIVVGLSSDSAEKVNLQPSMSSIEDQLVNLLNDLNEATQRNQYDEFKSIVSELQQVCIQFRLQHIADLAETLKKLPGSSVTHGFHRLRREINASLTYMKSINVYPK